MNSGYAVIDVETTGLTPQRHRVVEIGVVTLTANGEVETDWSTLLNPNCNLGPVHVHHITAADIIGAPVFAEIVDDLASLLAGRIITGHNVRFDAAFAEREFQRAGQTASIPAQACLDTMNLVKRAGVVGPGGRLTLQSCCNHLGVRNDGPPGADGLGQVQLQSPRCAQ
ncbi:MAG: hypothetical protein LBJ62_10980 [Bifidobacteriaceae bacterium]|jgi:DNA polymerase III epsilon subunit family exonuclease|nr:hypothetical protein [Bifidobacteriaceae bacterium]